MTDILSLISSAATAVGVFLAAWQLLLAQKQNVINFEDLFAREYRTLVSEVGVIIMAWGCSVRILVICVAALLPGCATIVLNGAETKMIKVDQPQVGEVVTAYVGDQLVQKGEIVEEKVLRVNALIDGVLYDVAPGVYSQVGHSETHNLFSPNGVVSSAFADPPVALKLLKADSSKLCVVSVYGNPICYKGDFEVETRLSERGTSFQQTLIYSGRIGNRINIGYREFSNNFARPAFNNDVEYDLSTSNVIGYKGAQIEVINADNSSIKYRVLKNFP